MIRDQLGGVFRHARLLRGGLGGERAEAAAGPRQGQRIALRVRIAVHHSQFPKDDSSVGQGGGDWLPGSPTYAATRRWFQTRQRWGRYSGDPRLPGAQSITNTVRYLCRLWAEIAEMSETTTKHH